MKETHIGFSVHAKDGNNEEARKSILDALRSTFRPEFLNRIDDIIVFNTLTPRTSRADRGDPAQAAWSDCWPRAG